MARTNVKFTKMHGLGNDFIVINGITEPFSIQNSSIKKLADRHQGIGFDQLLVLKPGKNADFSCDIFNSDGSEAEQCGNGMRCLARFIAEEKLSDKPNLTIATKGGTVETLIKNFNQITVNMGVPHFKKNLELELENKTFPLTILSLGNPHAILQVNSVQDFPVSQLAPSISTHAVFPEGINVGFMEIVNRDRIRLRTFERGAGETLACGSNACAAVVTGIQNQLLNAKISVELKLGTLEIEWQGKDHPVFLTGPAEKVFEGEI